MSLNIKISDYKNPVTGILDEISGAIAAYSLRKLKSTATKAIRVRRSSDNAEKDIFFIGENLDTADLLNFAGTANAYVTKWYDQSGNNKDAGQTSAAIQPQIVISGILSLLNNLRPSLYFNGSSYFRLNNNAEPLISATGNYNMVSVFNLSQNGYLLGQYSASTTGRTGFSSSSLFTSAAPTNLLINSGYTLSTKAILNYGRTGTESFQSILNNGTKQNATASNVSVQQIENTIGAGWNVYNSSIAQAITGTYTELIIHNRAVSDLENNAYYVNAKNYYGV